MSKPPSTARPWVLRSDLRLALVTGLGAGFGLLSPMGFGYYIPLTTAAVLTSSYGNSLNLSIQRMLGSVLGVIVLMIFSRDLQMPLALALGLALATVRFLGGALGLQVGYKVAGNIVIMGWLVHGAGETSWGTARLFWTAIGIALSLWATRTIWPSKSIPNLHQALATMVSALGEEFSLEADRLEQDAPARLSMSLRRQRRQALLKQLNAIRGQRESAQLELGIDPEHHPLHELWSELDLLCSQLLSVLDGLRGLPAPIQSPAVIKALHRQEAEVLHQLITLLNTLAGELRKLSLGDKQTLNLNTLSHLNRNLDAASGHLMSRLEKDTLQDHETQAIDAARMRQIVLRASLIDHAASALRNCKPGMASSTPVTGSRPEP